MRQNSTCEPTLSRSVRKASGATWNQSNENGLDLSGEFLIASQSVDAKPKARRAFPLPRIKVQS